MEYAKNEVLNIKYNTKLDKLELKTDNWFNKLQKSFKYHRFISTVVIAFVIFSIMNIVMIYSFMNILQNF